MAEILQFFLIWVAPIVLLITTLVVVHELGHFIVGRACGAAVDRFSIGMGPTLWARRDKAGVEWRIAAFPIGGYVKFGGDTNVASVPDQSDLEAMRAAIVAAEGVGAEKKYLAFKPLWQRTLIILAGPGANFLLAIALFAVILGVFGGVASTTKIEAVIPGGAAARAGFMPGDVVEAADGRPMHAFEDIQLYVQYHAGRPIDFTVARAGADIHLIATPSVIRVKSLFGGDDTIGRLGLEARSVRTHLSPLQALAGGAARTFDVSRATLFYLGQVATGRVPFNQLHGFVGMAHLSGAVTQQAVNDAHADGVNPVLAAASGMLQLAPLLSVSVGILNLLPIPVLDGGHLMFYAYELVARRPPRAAVQAVAYRAGLALLVGLMVLANWNDLARQHLFHFLGS